MSTFETIKFKVKNNVACLMLDRPDKHNVINSLMIKELRQVAVQISESDDIRVVVLTATGDSFCAGGDLNWMKDQAAKSREEKIQESSQLALMLRDLDELPKPMIGRIQGSAFGGGVGMISICDMAIATTGCKFGLTETRLGLIPATIGPYVVRRLGEGSARQIFMNGKIFDASKALRFGLLADVVEEVNLDDAIQKEVDAFLRCAPGAVAQAKFLCQRLARNPDEDQLDYTADKLASRWESEEARQGIDAFFKREKPPWTE